MCVQTIASVPRRNRFDTRELDEKISGVVTLAEGSHNGRVQRVGANMTERRRPRQIEIRELTPAGTDRGAGVLGRGMRDNPLHVQAFGSDPRRREEILTRMFETVLRQQVVNGAILGAFSSGELVGVSGTVPPRRCRLSTGEKLKVLLVLLGESGVRSTLRVVRWVGDWSRRDPKSAHWHLGPVGVERHLQGQGIGSSLLGEFCRRLDETRFVAYLETDKHENVAFYERFGFEVVGEHKVLGVQNWFMLRSFAGAA